MARLFLAVPIDEHCQQELDVSVAAWQAGGEVLRWTQASNRHLTLVFLGEVSAEVQHQLLANSQALPQVTPFAITLDVLQRFPDARGNVLALVPSAETPQLMQLQQAVSRWVESSGVVNPEQGRRFRPHITLARIRSPARFVLPATWLEHTGKVTLRVERVQLYSSEQIAGKRVYRPLLAG